MRIALIGATGGTGRHFIDLALRRGHELTALARTPARLADLAGRARVVQADGRDLASLTAALDPGLDAVVSIIGASGLMEARAVTDLYSATTAQLTRALQARGLRRLIVVSSAGVVPQANDGWFYVHVLKRFFLGAMYADMLRMEEGLAQADLDHTIVRPPYLTGGGPTGRYRVRVGSPFEDDRSLRRGDLAHYLLQAVEAPEGLRRAVVHLSE